MKKVLSIVAIVALFATACNSSETKDVPAVDSTTVSQDSVAVADSSITATQGGGDLKRNEGLDVK